MGGKSTSNSAVLDSNTSLSRGSFDLRSWQGLTEILRVGKESLKDPYVYGEFRNLVLEYAQKGGDEELRKKIDSIIATFKNLQTPARVVETPAVAKDIVAPVIPAVEAKPVMADAWVKVEAVPAEPVSEVRADETSVPEVAEAVPAREASPIGRFRTPPSFLPKSVAHTDEMSNAPANLPVAEEVQTVASPVVEKSLPPVPPSAPQATVPTPPSPAPRVAPPVVEAAPAVPLTYKSMEEHKARITEIKRSVHAQIGNPAMLIDTHNDIGKRYMVALLTALKATTPGGPVNIESAMIALEQAYAELTAHEAMHAPEPVVEPEVAPIPETPAPEVVLPEPEISIPDVPVTKEESARVSEERNAPEPVMPTREVFKTYSATPDVASTKETGRRRSPSDILASFLDEQAMQKPPAVSPHTAPEPVEIAEEFTPSVPETVPENVYDVAPEPEPISELIKAPEEVFTPSEIAEPVIQDPEPEEVEETILPIVEDVPVAESEPEVTVSASAPSAFVDPYEDLVKDMPKFVAPAPEPERRPAPTVTPPSYGAPLTTPSVWGGNKHTQKETTAYQADPIAQESSKVAVQQSELSTPQISEALHGLLLEWSLFSGSGLLGIGPGGVDHPLYKKLASLSMGEVLAGRFEKADAKVLKVIKEYVDAWRHEQGVAYTINETFEHYLRRVIQRILRRQNVE